MSEQKIQHTQQTFVSLGDEYLVQYFLCAHKAFRKNQILSRLFSMGHSLELYVKAALVSSDGVPPNGHNVPELINKFDSSLSLTAEEIKTGESLFGTNVTNIELQAWYEHEEAMELYQAQRFLQDLKYYLYKDGQIIFPARKSLKPINTRYLELVKTLRSSIKYRQSEQDQELVELVEHLGFENNPALQVLQ